MSAAPRLAPDARALLMLLPQTIGPVPVNDRACSAAVRQQIARLRALKADGLVTLRIEPTGPGIYNLHAMITQAGAAACRR